jgi:2,3-bisphosphoglycerate-independent phosphoglycerate mutase
MATASRKRRRQRHRRRPQADLDRLFAECPHIRLRAHGTAVGMPSDDDMGNSEVGHNAIGAGQVYSQGAALVANAIADGAIWQGEAWQQIVAGAKAGANGGVIHFIGLFSDGNVHSHIDHLKAMVVRPRRKASRPCASTPCSTAATCPKPAPWSTWCPSRPSWPKSAAGFDARIASGGGRQYITMDRYDANWPMVEKGWKTHVLGEGPQFANATEAVNACAERTPAPSTRICPSS